MSYSESTRLDQRHLRLVLRIVAIVCVCFISAAIAILLLVDPNNSHCPGWQIALKVGRDRSIWDTVAICGFLAFWMCILALNWKLVARMIVGSANAANWPSFLQRYVRPNGFPYDRMITCVGIVWCYACAQPLLDMFENCTLTAEGQPFTAPANMLDFGLWILVTGLLTYCATGSR